MKSKFLIYILPAMLLSVMFYGYSTYMDNPKNDNAPGIIDNVNFNDNIISGKPSNPNTTYTNLSNLKTANTISGEYQTDTIAPAGFPFPQLFNWNYSTIPNVSAGSVGAIKLNNKFIVNRWNNASYYRFNANGTGGGPGTFADSNSAYNAGAGAIRDMTIAPDGSGSTYLWGGSAGTTLFKLDSLGNRISSYLHTGAGYRAIAYDKNRKGFWSCNFNDNIVCRDTLGNVIKTITATTITGKYGMGFDSATVADSAYLWVWRQINTSQNALTKVNINSGLVSAEYVFTNSAVSVGLAGGAEVLVSGSTVSLYLNFQNQAVIGYDIKNPVSLLTNDVGTFSVNTPVSAALPSAPIIPAATIRNYGSVTQSFNVQMTISPGGYTSTKPVTSLTSLSNVNVSFDPFTPTIAGNYTVTVTTLLAGDLNASNNSLVKNLAAYTANYGGPGAFNTSSYFYANSTAEASVAPSQPVYCRIDTTGSTSLVNNGVAVTPITNGDLDDGYWSLLGVTGIKRIIFMGVEYSDIYVGTNGLMCFVPFVPGGGNWYPPAAGLPGNGSGGTSRPGIYPLWNDLNWGELAVPTNRLSYKIDGAKNQLVISYDNAPLYGAVAADEAETWQVVIELKTAGAGVNSNITVNIDGNSLINLPVLVGLQDATGAAWLQYNFINITPTVVTAGPLGDINANGIAIAMGPNASNLLGNCKALDLTVLAQGFWDGSVTVLDTFTVQIRSSVSPYNVLDEVKAVNNSSGNILADVGNISGGSSYYIVVDQRNTLTTWSAGTPSLSGQTLTYDFTTDVTQAYGTDAEILWNSEWCLWSGDVNKDGIIDGGDIAPTDNDVAAGTVGYVPTDVTGDDFVDSSDLSIVENNAAISPFVQNP